MAASTASTAAAMVVMVGAFDDVVGKDDKVNFYVSKIGGPADWVTARMAQKNICCFECSKPMALIAQLYAPVPGCPYDRNLHIFACLSHNSWRVTRSQRLPENHKDVSNEPTQAKPAAKNATQSSGSLLSSMNIDTTFHADDKMVDSWGDAASDDWGVADGDWGVSGGDSGLGAANETGGATDEIEDLLAKRDLDLKMHALSVRSPKEVKTTTPVPKHKEEPGGRSDCSHQINSYYLSIYQEPEEESVASLTYERQLLRKYQETGGTVGEGDVRELVGHGKTTKEEYEKSRAPHGDEVFERFLRRIKRDPNQILRYQWKGQPLRVTGAQEFVPATIPKCSKCGADRVFEVQLLPSIICDLTKVKGTTNSDTAASNHTNLDFSTVVIYTCSKSCWTTIENDRHNIDEYVFIQDPDIA